MTYVWINGREYPVQVYGGRCDDGDKHESHYYLEDGFPCASECIGRYTDCTNCDDRGCMDCVLRDQHDHCEWSCPLCEGDL